MIHRALLLVALISAASVALAETPLPELIARIEPMASDGKGIREEERKLADEIALHKTAAADLLLPLLKSESKDLRELAGYCVSRLPAGSLLKRHLPELTEACRKERGWLPNAIAYIDSDAALAFLAAEYRREPQTDAQIDHALIRTAPRCLPHLLRELAAAQEGDTGFLETLPVLWLKMSENAAPSIDSLLLMAQDKANPLFRRKCAIACLGAIWRSAKDAIPQLKALAKDNPGPIADAVREALKFALAQEAALELLAGAVAQARDKGELYAFRDLAELGEEAAPARVHLMALLGDPDPNVRLGACRTLGFTGRPELCWPALAHALKDPDWRVSFSACLSLAQLKDKEAIPALEKLAASHWYPRVRHAAALAVHRIKGTTPSDEQARFTAGNVAGNKSPEAFFFIFGESNGQSSPLGSEAIRKLGANPPGSPFVLWETSDASSDKIPSIKSLHPRLYGSIREASPKATDGTWPPDARASVMTARPGVSFVAVEAGEWVGGLFVIGEDNKATNILDENITALLDWDGRLVALSGIDHMGMSEGAVHEIIPSGDKWTSKMIHALPGCPILGALLPDGRLLANCEGGAVAISKDGKFEYLGSGEGEIKE